MDGRSSRVKARGAQFGAGAADFRAGGGPRHVDQDQLGAGTPHPREVDVDGEQCHRVTQLGDGRTLGAESIALGLILDPGGTEITLGTRGGPR